MLDAAESLEDVRVPPGNRLEALKGDRSGKQGIRINQQWRIQGRSHRSIHNMLTVPCAGGIARIATMMITFDRQHGLSRPRSLMVRTGCRSFENVGLKVTRSTDAATRRGRGRRFPTHPLNERPGGDSPWIRPGCDRCWYGATDRARSRSPRACRGSLGRRARHRRWCSRSRSRSGRWCGGVGCGRTPRRRSPRG